MGRLFGRKRHALTRAALEKRAIEESGTLVGFVEEREGRRPENDPIIRDHELKQHRVTLHDEETTGVYARQRLPEVRLLRSEFAERGIRNPALESVYESPQNEADLRTIATALEEMAGRVR